MPTPREKALAADRCLLTRHRPDPRDPTRMIFDAQSFAHVPPGEAWPERPATREGAGLDFAYAPDFVAEDAANAPAIQRGMASKGFRGSVLGDLGAPHPPLPPRARQLHGDGMTEQA